MIKPTFSTRRSFLRNTAATASTLLVPNLLRAQDGGIKKINVAGIGAGGKGGSDIAISAEGANIVAFCAGDRNTLETTKHKYPLVLNTLCSRRPIENAPRSQLPVYLDKHTTQT